MEPNFWEGQRLLVNKVVYTSRDFQGEIIPENEYFVLGDNRNNSNDSRNGWTVPQDSIIGKAWLSIWPPSLWGLAANYPFKEQIASAINE